MRARADDKLFSMFSHPIHSFVLVRFVIRYVRRTKTIPTMPLLGHYRELYLPFDLFTVTTAYSSFILANIIKKAVISFIDWVYFCLSLLESISVAPGRPVIQRAVKIQLCA